MSRQHHHKGSLHFQLSERPRNIFDYPDNRSPRKTTAQGRQCTTWHGFDQGWLVLLGTSLHVIYFSFSLPNGIIALGAVYSKTSCVMSYLAAPFLYRETPTIFIRFRFFIPRLVCESCLEVDVRHFLVVFALTRPKLSVDISSLCVLKGF